MWLFLAIVLEVAATVCMKLSDGFSKFVPTVVMVGLYGLSFFPMAVALKRLDVGIAYAVWSAVGTALISVIGFFLFKESWTASKAVALTLIVLGVVILNVSAGSNADEKQVASAKQVDSAQK